MTEQLYNFIKNLSKNTKQSNVYMEKKTPIDNTNHTTDFVLNFTTDNTVSEFFNFKSYIIEFNNFLIFINNHLNAGIFSNWYNSQKNSTYLYYSSAITNKMSDVFNNFFTMFKFNANHNFEDILKTNYIFSFFENNYIYNNFIVNIFKKQIISQNSFFFIFIVLLLAVFLIFWMDFFFSDNFNYMYSGEKFYDEYTTIVDYTVESEKELGSLDDACWGVSILICIFCWFFLGTVFFNYFNNLSITHVYIGLPVFFFTVLSMPSNLILDYGLLYPAFLRGSGNTTIMLLEFMYDVLATSIMYIRLFVQNVRFILMFFAFFECYEFFLNNIFIFDSFYFIENFDSNDFYNPYKTLLYVINYFFFFIYNIAHLIYTVISHTYSYLILVFWFFSFLYTTFFKEKLEIYFKNKNNNNN